MPILYRGFSTINRSKKFRVTDIDLVKQDLLNHFSTRKGERLMNPNYGSIIWGLLFEPFDDQTRQFVIDDVTTIVNYDPRVTLTNITITEQDYGMQIELDLTYIPTNQATSMSLQFDSNSQTLTTNGPY
jgi:phage baseplate assembly protein W